MSTMTQYPLFKHRLNTMLDKLDLVYEDDKLDEEGKANAFHKILNYYTK